MKPNLTEIFFNVAEDGKKTPQAWVYSILLLLALGTSLLFILATPIRTNPKPMVTLRLECPSEVIVTVDRGIQNVEVNQKPFPLPPKPMGCH